MVRRLVIIAPLLALSLGGCLAKSAIGVVTAPVRVASQAADWATTSQDEADRARGRQIRAREERVGRLQREFEELAQECDDGSDEACRDAVAVRREIDTLMAGIPAEPQGD